MGPQGTRGNIEKDPHSSPPKNEAKFGVTWLRFAMRKMGQKWEGTLARKGIDHRLGFDRAYVINPSEKEKNRVRKKTGR